MLCISDRLDCQWWLRTAAFLKMSYVLHVSRRSECVTRSGTSPVLVGEMESCKLGCWTAMKMPSGLRTLRVRLTTSRREVCSCKCAWKNQLRGRPKSNRNTQVRDREAAILTRTANMSWHLWQSPSEFDSRRPNAFKREVDSLICVLEFPVSTPINSGRRIPVSGCAPR